VHPRAFLRDVAGVWRRHGTGPALATLAHAGANLVVPLEVMHVIVLHRARMTRPDEGAGVTGLSARPSTDRWAIATGQGPARTTEHASARESDPPSGRTGHRPQITTALADEATLAELRRRGDWAIDEVKLAHWREGDLCLLSLVDGKPAGYTWVHERGCPLILPGLRLRLPPGMLYNFAGYTHPGFRGLGLQGLRHRAVLEHPRWASARALLGWVKATNHASRRGQARSGYVDIGRVVMVGRGTAPSAWHWCSASLAAHGLHAERVGCPTPASAPVRHGGVPPT
jgi:hypothetical protein